VDIWTYIGTIGIFTSLFLIFIRFLPMIAMSEVKTAVPEADPHFGHVPGPQSISPGGKERTR
jgi:molybdopterin-containing oxidoreductase family membrane subunit